MTAGLAVWLFASSLLALPTVAAFAMLGFDRFREWRCQVELKRANKCNTPWCARGYEHDGDCRRMQP